jgi:hypothetical protein
MNTEKLSNGEHNREDEHIFFPFCPLFLRSSVFNPYLRQLRCRRRYLGSGASPGFTPSPSGVRAVFITIASIV